MRAVVGLLLAALLVAGCGTGAEAPSGGPSTTGAPGTSDAPLPTVPPPDPETVGLTCGDGAVGFHPALLSAAGRAESEPDAAAAALRAEIASGARIPSAGWIRVVQTANAAQFLARDDDGEWWQAGFVLQDGRWRVDSQGTCQLQPLVPAGVSIAGWRLDPGFPAPAAGDRTIHVLINEGACASGRPPEGRVLPPTITVAADRVTVTILVRSLPGGQDCQGNPDFPIEVELPEPLGGRPLFDGGVYPPAGPITAYALDCGPVEPDTCRTMAVDIVANAERERPGERVTWLKIYSPDGDYDLGFADGTGIGADIN